MKLATYRWMHRLTRGGDRLEAWFQNVPGLGLPSGEVEVSTAFGAEMLVIPRDNSLEHSVYIRGAYEAALTSFLMVVLPRVRVFWDVGAHIGYYSLLGSRVMPAGGRVLAFEPHPRVRERLQRNVKTYGGDNVSVFQYGLSDEDAEREIFDEGEGVTRAPTFVEGIYESSGHHCLLRTGDGLVANREAGIPSPELIKLDIEGYEDRALRGLSGVLAGGRPPILVFEINRQFNDRPEALLDFLGQQSRYRFFAERPTAHKRPVPLCREKGDGPIPGMVELDPAKIPSQCNVIAYDPNHHAELISIFD